MSKKENQNQKQASVYTAGRSGNLKEDCLYAIFEKEEALSVWKHRESARTFLNALMVLALIIGAGAAVALWFLFPNETYSTRLTYVIIAGGSALALFVFLCFIKISVCSSCRKTYIEYSTSEEDADKKLDVLKREQVDPMLENRIVVCVRSILEVAAEFFSTDDSYDGEYKFVDEDELRTVRICEPANSVLVTLDGREVGALDLTNEFTMFRVDPGLHSLKLTIRKEYYDQNKTLTLETPVNPICVDGDYRIVYYAIQARANGDRLQYALKVYEYDDMVTFLRDIHKTDVVEKISRNKNLSKSLKKRASKLSRALSDSEEDTLAEEKKMYGSEKALMDEISLCLQGADHDARFRRDPRFEVYANINTNPPRRD